MTIFRRPWRHFDTGAFLLLKPSFPLAATLRTKQVGRTPPQANQAQISPLATARFSEGGRPSRCSMSLAVRWSCRTGGGAARDKGTPSAFVVISKRGGSTFHVYMREQSGPADKREQAVAAFGFPSSKLHFSFCAHKARRRESAAATFLASGAANGLRPRPPSGRRARKYSSRAVKMRRRLPPLLAVLCAAAAAYGHDEYERGDADEAFCSWTCAIFTLQWPGAFCQSLDNASLCHIPQHVDTWMIHGLWPMKVQECCRCWPMFLSDVQELREALENRWPSLLKSRSGFHFWRDEWEKHGACAACVEGLNSPLRYFQTCLKLRQHFDLHKVLEGGGIRPSCDRTYKLAEVQDVLFPLVGDKCEIQCVKDDEVSFPFFSGDSSESFLDDFTLRHLLSMKPMRICTRLTSAKGKGVPEYS